MNTTKKLAIFNLLVFIGTVLVNVLANLLPIAGITTAQVSDLYPNLFVPAGITFSIWGLIYALLGIFTVYQLLVAFRAKGDGETFIDRIGIWNIVLGVGNMVWIFLWHYQLVGASVLVMLVMLVSLILIYRKLQIGKNKSKKREVFLVHINFSIYLGWISIATIANITAFLVAIDWDGLGIDPAWWTVGVISVGVLLALAYIAIYKDIFYALVVDWALLGIYLNSTAQGAVTERPVISATVIGMIVVTFFVIATLARGRVYVFDQQT